MTHAAESSVQPRVGVWLPRGVYLSRPEGTMAYLGTIITVVASGSRTLDALRGCHVPDYAASEVESLCAHFWNELDRLDPVGT